MKIRDVGRQRCSIDRKTYFPSTSGQKATHLCLLFLCNLTYNERVKDFVSGSAKYDGEIGLVFIVH